MSALLSKGGFYGLCNRVSVGILGYDVKVMRQVIRLRKQDSNERQEMEALLDLYLHALGMAPAFEESAG